MNPVNTAPTGQANAPSLVEIIEVIRPQVEKIEDGFKGLRITLDALAEHLAGVPAASVPSLQGPPPASRVSSPVADPRSAAGPPREPPVATPSAAPLAAVAVPVQSAATTPPAVPVAAVPVAATPVAAPAARPAAAAPPPARAGSIPASGGAGGNWSQIIFGEQLNADPGIGALSGSLLAEVYATEPDAIGMLGYLLAFRSADQERKPKLLKELGEAFYLWKPDGNPRLLEPLIQWVHATLDRAGINNRIEVVQVGDRYDMQRHNAKDRGAEVSSVAGWVVLRDNGKVYSKANVAVR